MYTPQELPQGPSMAVNEVSQPALGTATGISFAAFLAQLPPEVVMGAFMGSVLYLLGNKDKPKWQWVLLFVISFIAGLLGANFVADLLTGAVGLLSIKVAVPTGLGAMLASSCAVNILSKMRDNPTALVGWFGRKLPEKKEGDQ